MTFPFAQRLDNVETSAIRELFKLLGKPGIISFAGGFPDSAMFDVHGITEAVNKALEGEPGAALLGMRGGPRLRLPAEDAGALKSQHAGARAGVSVTMQFIAARACPSSASSLFDH